MTADPWKDVRDTLRRGTPPSVTAAATRLGHLLAVVKP